ncbi:MAG: hypothetical protein U1F68_02530 [Gammaproteobacteria bacterium]
MPQFFADKPTERLIGKRDCTGTVE